MNTDMMRQVAAAIELEEAAFVMPTWLEDNRENICGYAACIAGTTVMQSAGWRAAHREWDDDLKRWIFDFSDESMAGAAASMLGLPDKYDTYTHPLFWNAHWWMAASKHLGLETGYCGAIDWITAKHAATVLHALAEETITFDQFWDAGEYDQDTWEYLHMGSDDYRCRFCR